MGETRNRDTVQAHAEGKQLLKTAKAGKRDENGKLWTYLDIAGEAGVSDKTVKRFFGGEAVERDSAIAICQALALEIREIVDHSEWNPPPDDSIDWHQVCHAMLNEYPLRMPATSRYRGHEAEIDLVPLGLVKPSRQPIRDEDCSPHPAEGTQQYRLTEKEIERQFEENEFFKEIIEQNKENFAIVGEPGAGKSTWLAKIAKYLDQGSNPYGFPICIPLGNLQGKTLEEYLRQIWLKNALTFIDSAAMDVTKLHETKLHELFNSGKAWLLLDGADEMQGAGSELPLQQIANQLGNWVGQARVVISCRLNVWETNDKALLGFETYRTLDFDQAGVADFIKQWFTKDGKPKLGEKLQAKLAEPEKDRIRDLVKNPLRLSLLCKIWDDKEDLPETKAGLYQRLRENFYKWKEKEFPTTWSQRQELNARLAKLALAALERKMPLRELLCYEVMGEDWFKLAKAIGWLNDVYKDAKTDDSVYAFFHLTFQEYFAALAVEDWHDFLTHVPNDPKQKRIYRIFEPQWKEVILLWLGREEVPVEQKAEFVKALVEFEDGIEHKYYKYRADLLSAAAIAELKNDHFSDVIVPQTVKWALGIFDNPAQAELLKPIKKEIEATFLETKRSKLVLELLKVIRSDTDYRIRKLACQYLGKVAIDKIDAIQGLLKRYLDKNEDKVIRLESVQNLGKVGKGNNLVADVLLDSINTINETINQPAQEANLFYLTKLLIIALDSLGKISGNHGREVISRLLEIIKATEVRESHQIQAIKSLGEIGTGSSEEIDVLLNIFEKTDYQSVRFEAVVSLAKLNLEHLRLIPMLIKFVETTEEELTYQNQRVLTNSNFSQFAQLQSTINRDEVDQARRYRRQVLDILENMASSHDTILLKLGEVLIKPNQNELTRREIIESLVKMGKGNEAFVIKTLGDVIKNSKNKYTIAVAATAIEKFNPSPCLEAINILLDIIKLTDDDIRSVMDSLTDNDTRSLKDSLSGMFSLYIFAINHLGKIAFGEPNAIRILEAAINSQYLDQCRDRIAYNLWKIDPHNPAVVPCLEEMLSSLTEYQHSWYIATTLLEIDSKNIKAFEALLQIIQATDNPRDYQRSAYGLMKVQEFDKMKRIVHILKENLLNQADNKSNFHGASQELIWHCAQTLPYPTFYEAWHHPELVETTEEGFSAGILQCNLAELPQRLNAALVETKLIDSVQLICIDGSNFFDQDNPVLEIYDAMLDSGCPERSNGEPGTMAALKLYYKSLCRNGEKRPILLFYQNPVGTPPQGFSETFLNALSKFDRGICIVTDQANIPLQSFSPNQPNLIADIVGWIREIVMES